MIVVADTTPINYLLLLDIIELLPTLYKHVVIPPEVLHELQSQGAPPSVRVWATDLPPWCEMRALHGDPLASLSHLDPGERQAIQLALQLDIATVLMDDGKGRIAASKCNLTVNGTLSILELAARRELIDFREALSRLEQTNFRLSASVRNSFLRRNP